MSDDVCRIEKADCLDWLRRQPDDAFDLVFTSPPYMDAREYREGGDRPVRVFADEEAWTAWMLPICLEISRVCRGLCAVVCEGKTKKYRYRPAPFLLLADLHRAGANLRKPCVYYRRGIPGSGGDDWLANVWEPIVCWSRPGKLPWSNPLALGKPNKYGIGGGLSHRIRSGERVGSHHGRSGVRASDSKSILRKKGKRYVPPALANPGNVIRCKVGGGRMGSGRTHENEAPFPEALAEFFVLSFCPEGGVVCDPFLGSGTTAAVAVRHNRKFAGCDLRQSQVELATLRVSETERLLPGMSPGGEAFGR